MELIAGKNCYYRGRTIPEGTRFTAMRKYGRALLTMKRAKMAGAYQHRAITETHRVDMQADAVTPVIEQPDELKAAREEYTALTGKRCWPGWSVETLRAKIAAHSEIDED